MNGTSGRSPALGRAGERRPWPPYSRGTARSGCRRCGSDNRFHIRSGFAPFGYTKLKKVLQRANAGGGVRVLLEIERGVEHRVRVPPLCGTAIFACLGHKILFNSPARTSRVLPSRGRGNDADSGRHSHLWRRCTELLILTHTRHASRYQNARGSTCPRRAFLC